MSSKKSKATTLQSLSNGLINIATLYKANCVNWTGKTSGSSQELYTEIIARELLAHKQDFQNILPVTRRSSYRSDHTKKKVDSRTNREEENYAKWLAHNEAQHPLIGEILDFQVPLKDTRNDKGVGKIDLLSLDVASKVFYLIELKYSKNKETLLRAMLEAYTYSKIVDKTKLITDFLDGKFQFVLTKFFAEANPDQFKIIPSVLVSFDCNAYQELMEMEEGHRPHLRDLALALGIRFFKIGANIR